jgi:tetratricopeptide (TPR) repeat protein
MPIDRTLRRAIRQIPELRSMPGSELNHLVERAILKEYSPGQVIWRTEKPLNFWVVIQAGEIVLERQYRGTTIHLIKLSAGDRVDADHWKLHTNQVSIARALTDARLLIIRRKASVSSSSRRIGPSPLLPARLMKFLWTSIFIVVILTFGLTDIRTILSDTLLLVSKTQSNLSAESAASASVLSYAELLDPSISLARNEMGVLRFQGGDLQGAEQIFAAGLGKGLPRGVVLNNLAVAHFAQGEVQQAIQIQKQAIHFAPDNAQVQYNLGILWMEMGGDREALRAFKEASILQPQWALPVLQQALLHLKMREYDLTEAEATRAIELDASQAVGHLLLTIALYEQGKDSQALIAVDTTLALTTDDIVPAFYKALLLEKQGKRKDALLLLNQLLQTTRDPLKKHRIAEEIQLLADRSQPPSFTSP